VEDVLKDDAFLSAKKLFCAITPSGAMNAKRNTIL
jgi:hypothetical protein